jgi:hypothetical protein
MPALVSDLMGLDDHQIADLATDVVDVLLHVAVGSQTDTDVLLAAHEAFVGDVRLKVVDVRQAVVSGEVPSELRKEMVVLIGVYVRGACTVKIPGYLSEVRAEVARRATRYVKAGEKVQAVCPEASPDAASEADGLVGITRALVRRTGYHRIGQGRLQHPLGISL